MIEDQDMELTSEQRAAQLRERAALALRDGRFDLADGLIASDDVSLAALVENLRIYQAELEIQNEELRRSEQQAAQALGRFSALFETLPIAELVVDHHGLVIQANPAASALFGLRPRHAHQHFLIRLVDEPDRGRVVHALGRVVGADSAPVDVLGLHLHTADGEHFIGDLSLAALPGDTESGREHQIVCAVIDRTEAVRQHNALQNAYDRLEQAQTAYRVLAEFGPDWDYWLGPDGEFCHVSLGCLAVSGYPAEAFLQDPELMGRLVHADDVEKWQRHAHAETTEDGPSRALLTFRLQTAEGHERIIEHACNPVRDANGRFLGRRGVNRDVTARVLAEQALRESEAIYRTLFESASEGLAILKEGRFVSVNHAALHLLGLDEPAQLCGRSLVEISLAKQPDGEASSTKARRMIIAALAGEAQRFEWAHLTAGGTPLPLEIALTRVEFGGAPAVQFAMRDLTPERRAREREQRAAVVFDNTSEGIIVTDAEARIIAVNNAFTTITGYSEAEALGQNSRMLQSGRHDATYYQTLWGALKGAGQWRGEFWNRRKSGDIYAQRSTITAVYDEHGQVSHYIAVIADITDVKRSEDAIYHLTHHDALTDLPNRSLLRARVEQSLARAARDGSLVALLYIDLDMFKTVNDSLGHPVGDGLLQEVAQAMAQQVRSGDSIARIGGDEFAVLMDDVHNPRHAAELAMRLLGACTKPFQVQGRELYITASIGISIYPMDGTDLDSLLRHADLAMYQAKEQGRNTYRFFKQTMTAGALERLHLENALRGALARREMRLEYQVQVSLEDRSLQGVEALLRWRDPRLGELSPDRFIPVAEEIGLIGELGAWVLEHAAAQLLAWDATGLHVPRLAVNLSVRQLERPDLPDQVRGCLFRTGLPAHRLELEVTESMLMRNVEQVVANLTALRDIGIQIAVDDFGSGFSSLGYLKHLPINRVKIDRVFVAEAVEDPSSAAIVRTIIALGHGLGMDVIAEGVETEEQARFLAAEGCGEGQGYLFGRPVSAAVLLRTLSRGE